jgi:hypothetical protein
MKTTVRVFLVAALACGSGCVRSDWIEQTLVTVNVTGTWRSTEGGLFELELEQQGPRVNGSMQMKGLTSLVSVSGPIVGSVTGDTFSFRGPNTVTGEMTVSENEMSGEVRGTATAITRRSITLQRVK